MNLFEHNLLRLLRVALGNEAPTSSLPNDVLWQEVFSSAVKQGVVNIAYDGLQLLMDAHPGESFGFDTEEMELFRYKWIGYGLSAENTYQRYVKTIEELAKLYHDNGFRMVLFKGYSLSRYYPIPSHRPIGDIDIAILDEEGKWCQRQADELFQKKLGINVSKARNTHHSSFTFKGLKVENHYEFSSLYRAGTKAKEFERVLQSVCCEGGVDSVEGNIIHASPTFNALFLMWHLSSHFCGSFITIRQLCDYMLFLEKEYEKIDWTLVREVFKKYGLEHFARVIDGILVHNLKAKRSIYDDGVTYPEMEERVLQDVFQAQEYKSRKDRLLRYPRFAWKYRLVRDSSWVDSLVSSIIIHMFHKDDLKLESFSGISQ